MKRSQLSRSPKVLTDAQRQLKEENLRFKRENRARLMGDKSEQVSVNGKQKKTRNKYGAIKVWRDGILFDSILEADWYSDLKLMQLGGLISDLELQVETVIRLNGILICVHYPDFKYYDLQTQEWIISEAKGAETEVWDIKWKLMRALMPNFVYELKKCKGVSRYYPRKDLEIVDYQKDPC